MGEFIESAMFVGEGENEGLFAGWNLETGGEHVAPDDFGFFFGEAEIAPGVFDGAARVLSEVVAWAIFVVPVVEEIIVE